MSSTGKPRHRQARLVEIAGAGPDIHFDQPERLTEALRSFLLDEVEKTAV